MGELARRRRARDLWISRSHLLAAAAGAAVLTIVSFGSGYLMGRNGGEGHAASGPVGLASTVPDDGLVELLARVEATAAVHGGVDDLTFPEALRGEEGGATTPSVGPAPVEEPLVVEPSAAVAIEGLEGDPLPAGEYTIDVLRTSDEADARAVQERLLGEGLDAFVAVEMLEGQVQWRLAVGGYRSEDAATAKLADVLLAIEALGERYTPSIDPL